MRSIVFLLIVAGSASVCRGGTETPQVAPTDPLMSPKVALVTFGPGRLPWERFGHNAIIVDDPAAGGRIAYNYGVFDFQQKHFLLNLALGHMRYSLVAEPLEAAVERYTAEGRSVTVQMLNLTPGQAVQLATFLAWNAQPQRADYPYDYFLNNCSTKVRDALNQVLGGALERQLAHQPAPHTFRFDAVRLVSPDFWLALGMDAAMGPKGDRPLSLWQESFVPMVLSAAVGDVVVSGPNGGTVPLVSDAEVVFPGKLPPAPSAPSELRLALLAVGIGLAAVLVWLAGAKSRLCRACFAVLASAWWLICGLSGLLLAGLWAFSDHWGIWENQNVLLLNPLCLFLPLVWWRSPRIACHLATLVAAAALFSLIVRTLPGMYQDNLGFISLAVPVHLSLAALAWRQRPVASLSVHRDAPIA
jgi:hypothetical protein